jgi:transposase
MSYSVDMRERAVKFVLDGGSQVEAGRLFGVDRKTIYHWLHRKTLAPKRHGQRHRVIDKARLAAHVREQPDVLLRERCAEFGVSASGMWRAMRGLGLRKKNDQIFRENP